MLPYPILGLLCLVLAAPVGAQVLPDSSAVAPADSLLPAVAPRQVGAEFPQRRFVDERPESLAAVLRRLIDVEWNQHGEPGGAGFLHLTPLSNGAGEIWIDGVPSRNPADLEPAVWDLSAVDLSALRRLDGHAGARASFDLHGERDGAALGRTRLRALFSRSAYESYARGLSLTTPRAQRELRADFEEWKSEDGFDFAAPSGAAPGAFGRAKQRRFHLAGRTQTRLGSAVVGFGRGRRDSPGELLGTLYDPASIERWTAQVYTGLDRDGADGCTRLRLYGLDWHEIDAVHGDARSDGARLGLATSRVATAAGTSWALGAERWSGVWNLPSLPSQRARGRWVGWLAASHELRPRPAVVARIGVDALHAEQSDATDLGGSALLRWQGEGPQLELGICRTLRAPSLLETDGRRRLDLADATQRDLVGGGELAIERQDRAHAAVAYVRGSFAARAQLESWRLSRGIGQRPVGGDALHFRGGVELRQEQVLGQVEFESRLGRLRVTTLLAGRAALAEPELAAGRGAGWPRAAAQARLRGEMPLRSQRNVILLECGYSAVAAQIDERTAALGGSGNKLPRHDWLDLRAGLRISDAELYLALDNALDAAASESLGTAQRPRQLRFGLAWTLWN
jgi:hypothetical protein